MPAVESCCAAPELTRILASPKSAMRGLKEEDVAGLDVVAVQDGPVAAAVHAGEPVRGRVEVPEGVVVELIQKLIEVGPWRVLSEISRSVSLSSWSPIPGGITPPTCTARLVSFVTSSGNASVGAKNGLSPSASTARPGMERREAHGNGPARLVEERLSF
jgi:hypothetical protein